MLITQGVIAITRLVLAGLYFKCGDSEMTEQEENLKKLAKTSLLSNFIKKHKGSWEHQNWVNFCTIVKKNGYYLIDFDQVGLLLERKKSAYIGKKRH